MKTYVFSLRICGIMLFFMNTLTAQVNSEFFDLQWGSEQKGNVELNTLEALGFCGNNLIAMRTKKVDAVYFSTTNRYLEKYDENLQLVKEAELDIEKENDKRTFSFGLAYADQILICSGCVDKDAKKRSLIAQRVNPETLELEKDVITIASIDYSNDASIKRGSYNYRLSENRSYLLIFYEISDELAGFFVYDRTFKEIWHDIIKFQSEGKQFEISDLCIGNDGSVAIVTQDYIYQDTRRPEITFHLYSYNASGKTQQGNTFILPGLSMVNMTPSINSEGKVICAGYYTNKGQHAILGNYCLIIEPTTNHVIKQSIYEFDKDFLSKGLSERQAEKVDKKIEEGKDYDMYDELIIKLVNIPGNKGYLLIGEEYLLEHIDHNSSTGAVGFSTPVFNFGSIYSTLIDFTGEIKWTAKIDKKQKNNIFGWHLSYFNFINPGKFCFIYNDHPKNLSLEEGEELELYKGGLKQVKMMVEGFSTDGQQKCEPIFLSPKDECLVAPKACIQYSENEVILLGVEYNRYRFGKLILKSFDF